MLFTLIGAFGFFRAAKFWVAVIMAVAEFIRIQYGFDLGLDEATITAIMGGLTALLVWLIPNKPKPVKPIGDTSYFPPKPGLW